MSENISTPQRVDLTVLRKQRFLIDLGDGNDENILELNTSDISIINRLSDGYQELADLDKSVAALKNIKQSADVDDEELKAELKEASDGLKEIDRKMREAVDYIFDSNVSEVCCKTGSMYDPINGKYRYEHIIETLMQLYSTKIKEETAKITKRMNKHAAKYTLRK